jgi:hypothetical protein
MILAWRISMACWIESEGPSPFPTLSGVIGREIVVVARSDEKGIGDVKFYWHGIEAGCLGLDHGNGRWTSTVTPSQLGEISVTVNFYRILDGNNVYESREVRGTITPWIG